MPEALACHRVDKRQMNGVDRGGTESDAPGDDP
jgi:hypothetical protein